MPASLDIHANSVSRHSVPLWIMGKADEESASSQGTIDDGKTIRHRLRRTAGKLLPRERVSNCGQKSIGSLVTLHSDAGRSHFGAVETCGSIWHCPVCASKVTEGRRVEIDDILKGHGEAGGDAFMATLTIPHRRFQNCAELRRCVANSWRWVKQGKPWYRARDGHGWIGDIRALEVTHGTNGWHPHLHILIFFKPGTCVSVMQSFGDWLFDAWESAVNRAGFGRPKKAAYRFEKVDMHSGAGDYVGKWGAALELTKAHTKKAKAGGRTPWQILADFHSYGLVDDANLFAEFAYAFKGARQLTWSREYKNAAGVMEPGIRQRYLTLPEASDEELATEKNAEETQVATLDRELFKAIASRGLTAEILISHEKDGLDGLLRSLNRSGIPWRLSEVAGIERGRIVPLISLGLSRASPETFSGTSPGHFPSYVNHCNERKTQ